MIYISGTIDDDAYIKFSEELREQEKAKPDITNTVGVTLISDGGSVYSALAFHDRIRSSPCTIRITGVGCIFSAATLILAAGDERRMTKNSWVMVHEDTAGVSRSTKVSPGEVEMWHARDLEDQWNAILEGLTNLSAAEWAELNKEVTYLTAADCLEYGLIDRIV